MTKKPKTVEFEEGWADELELTPDELKALMDGIKQIVETGEILEEGTPIDELPIEEQAQIIDMLERKKQRTRH